MKPKVLIVPAWYPTINDPKWGTFIKEQMEMVQDVFDFRIAVGSIQGVTPKRMVKNWLQYRNFLHVSSYADDYIQTPIVYAWKFQWNRHLSKNLDLKQYSWIYNQVSHYFQEIIDSGWKPDIIHFQSLTDFSVIMADIAEKNQIPFILTEHNLYPFNQHDFWTNKRKSLYDRADKVLCVSHHVLRYLLLQNCNIKSFAIVGNYLNNVVIGKEKQNINKTNILFIASHPYCKDIDIFLKSIMLLKGKIFSFNVNLVGFSSDSSFGRDINKLIDKYAISDIITIRGHKNRDVIGNEYSSSNLLVSTSYSETFGLCVAEAILNGIPVVTTDSGGVREFVNESNGIVVPIREPELLAHAIQQVIENSNNYNPIQMSQEIAEKYGYDSFRKLIIEQYTSVLNK